MFSKTKVAFFTAIPLSIAFPASAATKHHLVAHVHPEIYNVAPKAVSGSCSPTGVPLCSNICSGAGPCAPPDSW